MFIHNNSVRWLWVLAPARNYAPAGTTAVFQAQDIVQCTHAAGLQLSPLSLAKSSNSAVTSARWRVSSVERLAA